jgi:hypothetical protein
MYPMAPDLISLIGRAPSSSHVQQFRILPPYREGFGATTACPAAPCGPWSSSKKKRLSDLPTQPGSPVPNACTHVPKVVGVRDIFIAEKTLSTVAVTTGNINANSIR